jgi:hypothetical protein
MPVLSGSAFTSSAAFEAIKRLDGDAKGIKFMPKEASRTPSNSISDAIPALLLRLAYRTHIFMFEPC